MKLKLAILIGMFAFPFIGKAVDPTVTADPLNNWLPALRNGHAPNLPANTTMGGSPITGVSDGDKGDITVSTSGATWTIDAKTISLAKMADMATASFLGRNTAGTGSPEVLSISSVKTMLGIGGAFGTAAYVNTGSTNGTIPLLGTGGHLANATMPLGAQLYDNAGTPVLAADFGARLFKAVNGTTVIDFNGGPAIYDYLGVLTADLGAERYLYASDGTTIALNWADPTQLAVGASCVVYANGNIDANSINAQLWDGTNVSVSAASRQLIANDGSTVALDWSDPTAIVFLDSWVINAAGMKVKLNDTDDLESVDTYDRQLVGPDGSTSVVNWNSNVLLQFFNGASYITDGGVYNGNGSGLTNLVGDDTAYDATSWDGNTGVPTKNAVRDRFVAMIGTDVQAYDADLTTWAGITPASDIGTFLATPTSANLALAVTNETGTGALVFATSPTLVTPALGTPVSGVVTNLTGTASININGTVGATTPATGAFTSETLTSKITTYNNIATEGNGVGAIVKATRVTAQAAANSSIASYTTPASDGSYLVSGNINVTAAIAISTSLNVDYTDETNTARTMIIPISGLGGTFLAGGLATSTGPFESSVMHIRTKASTVIKIYTAAGTFTSAQYNAEGVIRQVQ